MARTVWCRAKEETDDLQMEWQVQIAIKLPPLPIALSTSGLRPIIAGSASGDGGGGGESSCCCHC